MAEEIQNDRMRSLIRKMQGYLPGLNDLVTDLKTLEVYLNELANMIYTFADAIDEGVVLVQENRFLWTNKAAGQISGYSIEEIMNLNVEQALLPDYRDKYKARLAMLLAGDKASMPVEWEILRKDRTVRFINVFAYKVRFSDKPAVMVIFYDITEEKKLQEEMSMRSQLLNSVNDSVLLMEPSGRILYVNDAVCEITGYSRDELLAMNIVSLGLPERAAMFKIRMKQFSEHKEARYKAIVVRKDGARVPVEIRGKIIRYSGRQLLLGVAREIVTSKETENNSGHHNGR